MDVNEVYTLFEEIRKQLKQMGEMKPPAPQPQVEIPDLSVIPELTAKLDEVINEVRKPVKTEHRHIFSIASSKVFVGIIVISILLLISSFIIYYQRKEISGYKDNDLKYRYVKMTGETTPEELNLLENIFDNNRDSVKLIRKDVEKHEKAVIEEAKRMEKVRLKEEKAERLKKEAENLKQQK